MKHETKVEGQPLIETERFVLRPPRPSDAGLISLYAGDIRVAGKTRSIPHPLPPGAIEMFIGSALSGDRAEDVWVIDGTATGQQEVMGLFGLERVDDGRTEVGYWIAPPFWNTGLASEALRAMIEANPHGATTYFASVFQDNPASARVLTNAGFQYIGDAEAFSVARGGRVPTWTYLRKLD